VIMNKKLLIGIIISIAAAIVMPMLITGILIAVWIYLVWMVRKKKTNLFHDQMEPKLAKRRLKMLKAFLLAAGISMAVGVAGVIAHNALYGLSEIEEPISFFIGISGLWAFIIATIGSLIIFLKGRGKQDKGIPK